MKNKDDVLVTMMIIGLNLLLVEKKSIFAVNRENKIQRIC